MAFRIAQGLYDRGHDVSVISTQPNEGPVVRTVEDGMLVFRFRPKNIYYTLEDTEQSFAKRLVWHLIDLKGRDSTNKVRIFLNQIKPDVVVTHNLKGIGLGIPRAIQSLSIPHIHVLHDVQLVIPSGLLIKGHEADWMNRGFLQKWYEKATAKAIGTPDVVISPSKYLLDFHQSHGLFKNIESVVLQNPSPEFGITERKKPGGSLKLLFLGSLEEHKGIRFLIETLRASDYDFELMIAGKGSLDEYVGSATKEDQRIQHFGPFNMEEAADLLSVSDCLVAPSLCYENSPTVIYESLSCGVPVVASNIGGIPELIQEGENGYLFEAGDGESLLHKLGQIARNREVWFERQDEIRMAIAKFSMTYYLDRFEEIIKRVRD